MALKEALGSAHRALRSKKGRNVLAFCVFLAVSAVLWWVIALNDEGQTDIRMPVVITHIPDSVTMVSRVPENITVSVMGRGSQLLKYSWGKAPDFRIDFRMYRDDSYLKLSNANLKTIARNVLGGSQIAFISPDSMTLAFTSQPPTVLPVRLDCKATPGPQVTLSGNPTASPDSVKVYVAGHRSLDATYVATEPLRLHSINGTVTRKVRLIPPPDSRVIPDSVEVTVHAEALIFKTRKVKIEPQNVPSGMRLITFPSQIDAMYMVPVSEYLDVEPNIKVVADYNTISPATGKVRLKIAEASSHLQNVQIPVDSAEYIIEKF